MPLIVAFFFALYIAASAQLETGRDNARQERFAENRHTRTILLADLVSRYLDEKGGIPPADLATLAATPGFEEAAQFLNTAGPHGNGPFLYTVALTSGGNSYHRIIAYSPPPDGSINATEYLEAANNQCGATAASNAAAWCGHPKGSWYHTETLAHIPGDLNREREQQQQTLQKFAKFYSVLNTQAFPIMAAPNNVNDSAATLISQLTGYTYTATTCTGVWNWQTIPLTCEDLYTVWGTPRVYNFKTDQYIALYAEAPWQQNGLPIIVASQLDART